jgi:hypothetical protein
VILGSPVLLGSATVSEIPGTASRFGARIMVLATDKSCFGGYETDSGATSSIGGGSLRCAARRLAALSFSSIR